MGQSQAAQWIPQHDLRLVLYERCDIWHVHCQVVRVRVQTDATNSARKSRSILGLSHVTSPKSCRTGTLQRAMTAASQPKPRVSTTTPQPHALSKTYVRSLSRLERLQPRAGAEPHSGRESYPAGPRTPHDLGDLGVNFACAGLREPAQVAGCAERRRPHWR